MTSEPQATKDELHAVALEKIDRLCDQWEKNSPPLPPDARHLLLKVAKEIVLDCARICDQRASVTDRSVSVRNEATKCGAQIRHVMLCHPNESICLYCDGDGCDRCGHKGTKEHPDA